MIYISTELSHHGVKGMKWGVRKEKYSKKKEAKRSYMDMDKDLRKLESEEYGKYREHIKKTADLHSKITKSAKASYKSGEIDKETYKKIKRASRNEMYASDRNAEYKMAIGQYQLQKARKANHLLYIEDVYGKEHKKYEKGKKALESATEYWSTGNSTYAVSQGSDGRYKVTRTDIYVY